MVYGEKGLFIDDENLDTFAENIARSLKPEGGVSAKTASRSLMVELRRIKEIYVRIYESGGKESRLPSAHEWLLDNWYLIQREGLSACAEMRGARQLRKTGGGTLLGELCAALVRAGGGYIDKERCELFLTGFQRSRPLARAELALFVPCLKAALVSELADICRTLESDEPPSGLGDEMERRISSLRLLASIDLSDAIERTDRTEQILSNDPAGVYTLMDEKTRDHYRRQVSKLARRYGVQEYRVAQRVLKLAEAAKGEARHVGYHLFTVPLEHRKKERSGAWYITGIVLTTVFLSVLAGFLTRSWAAALLLVIPISDLVKNLLDFIILRFVSPRHVPRMELGGGVPKEGRTICVISALITGEGDGEKLVRLMEEYRLANRDAGENLMFGILADLPESGERVIPEARGWLDCAAKGIEDLNRKYGGGFYLLTREREWNRIDAKYMGWERKRGAIMELARLLRDGESTLSCTAGNKLGLRGVKYILTLDTDTNLCPGTARELIGAMLHPLNTPVIDEQRRVVVRGTAIIQPRMSVGLESAGKSDFSRFFAGQGGTDPYGCDAGELYMDLFARGGFAGKGVIDAEALLTCLDGRIPENTVLSHDALEGAYLRGYYMGDVELTDSFPSRVPGYYGRMHRWTRGDWQNLPWLGRRGRVLSDIDRWRLFDSMRRSLVAPMTFASITAGFFHPAGALMWAALAALLSAASRLLLTVADSAMRKDQEGRERYHSTIINGVGGGLVQTVIRLIFLPYEAWVCFSAIASALWRMCVSHRNMLEWQTAAQGDRGAGRGVLKYYLDMWFSVAAGIATVVFAPTIIGMAAGVVWILSPLYAMSLSAVKDKKRRPPAQDRSYLLQCAKEIWRFFEKFAGPEDNFLPPDNWQEQPPVGVAHRTSPTNIGLCLLSALSAADLGLATSERAMELIENTLATMERMPKWRGHLYNWYDTRTLKSLEPKYVSTVDSGNLAGCLIVLRRGLIGYGREDLAKRADDLLRPMNFAPLYDKSRRLFYIGIDLSREEPTKGWYDLLASEARLAGYIAIAKGDIERRHWRRLSRAQVGKDGYRGMASWTGTMFEYLMPELFLPCYRDSLLYESAKFCLYVQKRRTASRHAPWGISESAFYSLDPALNYRYKAHGCGALALKRGMDTELVVSPYSSFLALSVEPHGVVKNLKRLEGLGARGKYGFWEAVDFTPTRMSGKNHEVVKCVMAHHVGMSLVAIANYLCGGVHQKRFMSEPAMSAYSGLLQEKVPVGGVLLHRRGGELPEKPARASGEVWTKRGEGVDYLQPDCCALSNGAYHVVFTESGQSLPGAGGIMPYRHPLAQLGDGHGFSLYLRVGERLVPLLPTPGQEDTEYSWEFSSSSATVFARGPGVEGSVRLSLAPESSTELRSVSFSVEKPVAGECELICTFEPVMAFKSDYVNHPAFYKLGLFAYEREGALMIKRVSRGSLGECFMCLSSDTKMSFGCDRAAIPGRGGLLAALDTHTEKLGWLSDPMVCARIKAELKPGSPMTVRLALSMSSIEEEAYSSACELPEPPEEASMPAIAASLMQLEEQQIGAAMEMISPLIFPGGAKTKVPVEPTGEGRDALWRFGISGDLPIVCAELRGEQEHPAAEALIKRHALLSSCGVNFDLVFLTGDGGDYRKPGRSALSEAMRRLDREAFIGAKGGVHFVDRGADCAGLRAASALTASLSGPEREQRRDSSSVFAPTPDALAAPAQSVPEYGWAQDGSFSFKLQNSLPPRSWGNILTNGSFSAFATDCATGHMWYKNAREMKLSPWRGDPLAVSGPETLELELGGARHSLFATPEETEGRVIFDFGSAVWEKSIGDVKVKTTAFVPQGTDARVLIIETENLERNAFLLWSLELLLGSEGGDKMQVVTESSDGLLRARNPRSPYKCTFSVCASVRIKDFTCDRLSLLRGDMDGSCGAGFDPCFGIRIPVSGSTVIVCGCDAPQRLMALANPAEAKRQLGETKKYWRSMICRMQVNTPDAALNHLLSGWIQYQALACRVMGRSSVYQNGGAYGFRDQLQDIINLIPIVPEMAREHLVECCRHQFEEGDVQHWWHPMEGGASKGVRTRCSDDLLWLAWGVWHYTKETGDLSVLSERVPYLHSAPLSDWEDDRYESPAVSGLSESVLEHALRAVDMVLRRGSGEHGLLLIGSGDWNDGMSRVGAKGKGESVWLTWFFSFVADEFAQVLEKAGNPEAGRIREAARVYGAAANAAWDGQWYLRGYFDDGSALGSSDSKYCRIDSIAQSFAAFCPYSDKGRVETALSSAAEKLFDRKNLVVKLFDPAFEDSSRDPGYIRSYGPGFRENGGQYTHGAIWLASACLKSGKEAEGYELLKAIMPENHDISRYGAEPFVIPADVYSAPGSEGQAGWSWYTGSAGWFYRVATEDVLGLKLRSGRLFIEPRLPRDWPGYSVLWQKPDGAQLSIEVTRSGVTVNGRPYDGRGLDVGLTEAVQARK